MPRLSSLLTPILWLAAIIIYVLAVLPQGSAPQVANDKIQHMAAFFTLAVLAALVMPGRPVLWIAAGLALFGAAIEITQLIPALHREASIFDWFADIVAIAVGLLATTPLRRRLRDSTATL